MGDAWFASARVALCELEGLSVRAEVVRAQDAMLVYWKAFGKHLESMINSDPPPVEKRFPFADRFPDKAPFKVFPMRIPRMLRCYLNLVPC